MSHKHPFRESVQTSECSVAPDISSGATLHYLFSCTPITALAARFPDDHSRGLGNLHEFTPRTGGSTFPFQGISQASIVRAQNLDLPAQSLVRLGQVDDRLDTSEVHSLLLTEPLNLPEESNIGAGVASSSTTGTHRGHQPHPVIGPEGLGVHPREFRGHRNDEHFLTLRGSTVLTLDRRLITVRHLPVHLLVVRPWARPTPCPVMGCGLPR